MDESHLFETNTGELIDALGDVRAKLRELMLREHILQGELLKRAVFDAVVSGEYYQAHGLGRTVFTYPISKDTE
jgi:hypothetical protein